MISNINKILVLGKTGNGKSTLCNYILGYEKNKFNISNSADRCTTNVQGCISKKFPDIFMIDTPGLDDPHGEDQKIINEIREQLKTNHCQGIKAIILLVNLNDTRLSSDDQRIISIYAKMFPNRDFWQHVGIVFTKSYEFFPKEQLDKYKSEKQKFFIPSFLQQVEEVTNEINKNQSQEKKILIPQNFQYFFTDCGELYGQIEHVRTDKDIKRLIYWAKSLDYIDFQQYSFDDIISSDYASVENLPDAIDDNEKYPSSQNQNETIWIKKYYKRKKVKDFHGNENIYQDESPYKTEKFFIITKEEERKETENVGTNSMEKEKIITKKYEIVIIYNENREEVEKKEHLKGENSSTKIKKQRMTQIKLNHNYKTNEEISQSKNEALQKIEEAYNSLSTSGKVFMIAGVIITGVTLIAGVVAESILASISYLALNIFGIKLTKPQKWKTIYKYYRDETYEYFIYYDENGKEDKITPLKLIDIKNEHIEKNYMK